MKFLKNSIAIITFMMMANSINLYSQEQTYFPNGDPDQWTVKLTPFLWLPVIGGELESNYLSESFSVPATDILGNLKMAFMFNAEIAKGEFFAMPSYVYTKLGTKEVKAIGQDLGGNDISITATPELKMNIIGLIAGWQYRINKKIQFDPYVGFRYNSFNTFIGVDGIRDTTSMEEKADFWDPVVGFRAQYFPHPRVPTMLKVDVGGFGVGSNLSWTATLTGGYSVSPQVDLVAGFTAYGTTFVGETKLNTTKKLKVFMYGINIGVNIFLPNRHKNPEIFKKFE